MIGGSDAAWESTLSEGGCANVCTNGEAGWGVLCKDGRRSAHNPSKPTLIIPARMRRRFTRSSEIVQAIALTRDETEFYLETAGMKELSCLDVHLCSKKVTEIEVLQGWLQTGPEVSCGRTLVNHNQSPPKFSVSVASKRLSIRISGLESTLTGIPIGVDYKRVTGAFSAFRYHFLASIDNKGVAG
jgi:hypothetical protein